MIPHRLNAGRVVVVACLSAFVLACGHKAPPPPVDASADEDPAPKAKADTQPLPTRERGRRTAGVTNEVIRRHRADFRACYDRTRKRDADLEGKVMLVFTIRPDGSVKSAEVDRGKSDIASDALDACLVDTVKAIKFPEADEEVGSKMHYPFEFNRKGDP